jgi:hypothetical protein
MKGRTARLAGLTGLMYNNEKNVTRGFHSCALIKPRLDDGIFFQKPKDVFSIKCKRGRIDEIFNDDET